MDLWNISAIDIHAHFLSASDTASDDFSIALERTAFASEHPAQRLYDQRSLRDVGALLGCEPTTEAIATQCNNYGAEEVTRICFEAANLEAIFLDHGHHKSDRSEQSFSPTLPQKHIQSHQLICLESLAEHLISKVDRFDVFLEWFRSELDPLPQGCAGFQSIAATRSGLDIHLVYPHVAEECFYHLKHQQDETRRHPSLPKELIDFLLLIAFEVAARYRIPLQFQAGFSGTRADLRLANPLHLRPILEESQYSEAPIVILCGAYPYTQEAGILSALYQQVYVSLSTIVPGLSMAGITNVLGQLLECAPISKILYSSGGQARPELLYLGAKWGRMALEKTLEETIRNGDLTIQEAEKGAIAILNSNARRLYSLPTDD